MGSNVIIDEKLFREYILLAKAANERLRVLKNMGRENSSAYKAGLSLAKGSGATGKYFSKARPQNMRVLKMRTAAVKKFLKMQGSTRSGLRKHYERVCATINKRYGLSLTVDQLEAVFESELWDKLEGSWGSETAVKVMASIQRSDGDVTRTLKSIGPKRLGLSEGERNELRNIMNEFVTPDDSEIKEIEGFFKG